jgi:hypothetical protein
MDIVKISPGDEFSMGKFYALARQVYRNDLGWVPQSESMVQSLLAAADRQFVQLLLCLEENRPLARAAAILNPDARNENGQPVGYIGLFECLEQHALAGVKVLEAAELLLQKRGAVAVQAPRVNNYLMGLVVNRFDLPQTILTPYNPPYFADIFTSAGYKIAERLYTYRLDRKSSINIPLRLPGCQTRTFNRQNLEAEVLLFHNLQKEIFSSRAGWIPRSLEEDRQMIHEILPIVDDELIIIAEDRQGHAVGLLVCVPDIYQAFRGLPVDQARIITIGVVPPLVNKGIGVLMGLHLGRNLLAKGYQSLEASFIRASNIAPQNLLTRRFQAQRDREFALFEKALNPSINQALDPDSAVENLSVANPREGA